MIKNYFRILKKPYAHLQTILKTPVKFQKDRSKTVGGVKGTKYLLKTQNHIYMYRFVIIVKYLTNFFKLEWNLGIKFTLRFFFLSVYDKKKKKKKDLVCYSLAWHLS